MAANYPTSYDTMSDPGANLSGPPLHSTIHNQINDVIEAMQVELGLTPSGAYATVADALAAYAGLNGGVILTDAAQSIADSTPTDVTWGTEVKDPDGWTSGGSATLTVPAGKAGRYIITYTGEWTSGGTATYTSLLMINGAGFAGHYMTVAGYPFVCAVRTLAVGDTIKINTTQTSGGAVGLVSRLEIAPLVAIP